MRHAVLITAAILATSPAWADDKQTARAIGWAIGCGCSRTDVDTMVKHLGRFFFPDTSEAELKSLAGYVKSGNKESQIYDNSDNICSDLCYQYGDMFKSVDDAIETLEQGQMGQTSNLQMTQIYIRICHAGHSFVSL